MFRFLSTENKGVTKKVLKKKHAMGTLSSQFHLC